MAEGETPSRKTWPLAWRLPLCFVVAVAALGGYWSWDRVLLAREEEARERCVMKRWELSMAKRQTEMFGDDALEKLLNEGQLPPCPNGGVYTLGEPGRPVTCSLPSDQGALPRERPAALELYRRLEALQAREAAAEAEAAAEEEETAEQDEETGL